jgi:hypothetical protein
MVPFMQAAEVFERAWALIPLSLHDDEENEEMKLVRKLRGIFRNAGPGGGGAAGPGGGGQGQGHPDEL